MKNNTEQTKENTGLITTICLVRHGETDWNALGKLQGQEDIELNDVGRKQARNTARYFEKEIWDVIVSSPLKRAYETAQIIGLRVSIPEIHVVEEMQERSYGAASGLLPEERKNRFPDHIIPGQEDFEHLQKRAITGLTKIANKFNGRRIIVVSHGALINSILYTFSDGAFGSFTTRLKNACLNKLIFENSRWHIEYYNKTVEELL